jgi:predicted lysophospholipase L1 biosynthesis ABC-type transport system permease subunit
LTQGLRLAAIGAIVGLVGALGAGRLLQSLVPDVQAADPRILSLVALLMLAVAAAAAFVPATRASAVDPAVTFKNE